MKQLIINADDYGFCPSVNSGIIKALKEGYITDFSFIIIKGNFLKSIDMLKDKGIADCGLHINLTAGSSEISGQTYTSAKELVSGLLTGRISLSKIIQEIDEQINLLSDAGIKITHLDSHQNVHLLPIIFSYIEKFKIPIRMPSDFSSLLRTSSPGAFGRIAVLNTLTYLNRFNNKSVVKTVGQNFYNNTDRKKEIVKIKQDIINGKSSYYELAVHPGYCECSGEAVCRDAYTVQRVNEFQALKQYKDLFNHDNIRKTSFSSLV